MLKKSTFKSLNSDRRQMSIEKPVEPTQNVQIPQQLQQITHSVISKKVHFMGKEAFGDKSDTSLLWQGTFTLPVGARKSFLVFRNIEYVISNWSGDQFPSCLYLTADGVAGYFDSTLTVTQNVAALQLSEVNATMDESAVRTYDLKYVLRDSVTWELPLTMSTIKVRVKIDGATTPVVLPLPNPLTVNLELRTQ